MKSTVGLIGYGIVGRATSEFLKRMGHKVLVADNDEAARKQAWADGYELLKQKSEVEATFICVPESAVGEAVAFAPDHAILVIRSTVSPGTTKAIGESSGRPLVHMPEFLREATALWDVLNPNFILIGCEDRDQGAAIEALFSPSLVPVIIVPSITSEMVKLTMNAHLHTLISFWNEIHLICERAGIESHLIGRLCSKDPRVSTYGANMHGKPVGGRCLPKDLDQLLRFASDLGIRPGLLQEVKSVNHTLASRNGSAVPETDYQVLEVVWPGGIAGERDWSPKSQSPSVG